MAIDHDQEQMGDGESHLRITAATEEWAPLTEPPVSNQRHRAAAAQPSSHLRATLVGQEVFAARDDVVRLATRPIGTVLDVGCGPGLTAAAFRAAGAREVWGVERDPILAEAAQAHLDRLISVDVSVDPLVGLAPASVDVIVYADVLEHLIDPWAVLAAQRALLRPGGSVLISLPNVRHARVVGELLLRGTFTYRAQGILSIGHLRFFTTRSMRSLIAGAGYQIVREEATYAPWGHRLRRLSLGLLDDFAARQRLFLARVADRSPPA